MFMWGINQFPTLYIILNIENGLIFYFLQLYLKSSYYIFIKKRVFDI